MSMTHAPNGDPVLAWDEKGRPIFGYNEHGRPVCNSPRSDGSGRRCRSEFVFQNGRCKKHGGLAASGVAVPQYKDGRQARYNPQVAKLADKYRTAVNDPELNSLRQEIALVQAQMELLIETMETTGQEAWAQVVEGMTLLRTAVNDRDAEALSKAAANLDRIVARGTTERDSWHEFTRLAELKRRMVKDERDHLLKTDQLTTIEEMLALQTMFLQDLRDILLKTVDRQIAFDVLRQLQQQSERYLVETTR